MAKASRYEIHGGVVDTSLCSLDAFRVIESTLARLPATISDDVRRQIRRDLMDGTEAIAAESGNAVEEQHARAAVDRNEQLQSLLAVTLQE